MPAHLEQNTASQSFLGWAQDPLTSSLTADGKPAPRYELTPPTRPGTIAADIEANVNGPSGEQTPQVYTLGDGTPVAAPSGVQTPHKPQVPVVREGRSSLSDSYDALDDPQEGKGPTVVALDAGEEDSLPSGAKARSSIYQKYGTRESVDMPGPLPELSPGGIMREPSGGQPLAIAKEESFGSAYSGWSRQVSPGNREPQGHFEDAKPVEDHAVRPDAAEQRNAGSVHDHIDDDFMDCDFHEADESLPGSPASLASADREPSPERTRLGGDGVTPPARAD